LWYSSRLPIGVLFDLYCSSHVRDSWHIEVYFRQPVLFQTPADVQSLQSFLNVERTFFHSFKQALTILFGSCRSFNEMNVEQQNMLWGSIVNNNGNSFGMIIHDIIELPRRAVPVRLIKEGGSMFQKVIKIPELTSFSTAGMSLSMILKEHFHVELDTSQFTIQGIDAPLEVSIVDLWEEFHFADLFIYIVCSNRSQNSTIKIKTGQ
jgi:hypothetical protein